MQFFFAWADASETTFNVSHQVEDLSVFSFVLAQHEGDFATLDIVVPNPETGLLAPGRQIWAWFSVDTETTDGVVPLFFGRLVALPQDIDGETVRLSFQARPGNYDSRKRTAASALRVTPYYDALWVAPDRRDDPDAVLEFYPKLWHCHRTSHAVTASDIVTGEGDSIDFGENIIYDSLAVAIGSPPIRAVKVEASVTWDQVATGSVDLKARLLSAFQSVGSGNGWVVTSLTGGGLSEDWPEKGDRIGSGWTVGDSSVTRVDGLVVEQGFVTVIATNETGEFPVWTLVPEFEVDWSASRQYAETVTFTLRADCQDVVTLAADDEVVYLTLASSDADKPIDAGALKPVRDVRRRSYFPTDRGRQSLTALISMARAQILARARAVEVSFDVPFLNALALDCTMNVSVDDDRLPGGTASGKVVAYQLSLDGDEGALGASITIGCMVGEGNTVSGATGTPTYVDAGYVNSGWQVETGEFTMPIAGEVQYETFAADPDDDGVDLLNGMQAVNVIDTLTVSNGEFAQRAVLSGLGIAGDLVQAAEALNEVYTEVDLELVPLDGGPFETSYAVNVSSLMVPRTINLEAA